MAAPYSLDGLDCLRRSFNKATHPPIVKKQINIVPAIESAIRKVNDSGVAAQVSFAPWRPVMYPWDTYSNNIIAHGERMATANIMPKAKAAVGCFEKYPCFTGSFITYSLSHSDLASENEGSIK